jgi:hypothetical protein
MKPQRIQLSRKRGWRMPDNTVKVDRTTKWGNPFTPRRDRDKAYCAKLFLHMCGGWIALEDNPSPDEQIERLRWMKLHISELRGKNLACWCRLSDPCHADVLLRAANQ